jgi:hypothetical protein
MDRRDDIPADRRGRWPLVTAAWPFAASALALWTFYAVGDIYLGSYVLDLGSVGMPNAHNTYFLFYWTIFGSLAAGFLVLGVTRALDVAARAGWNLGPGANADDARWVVLISVAACLLPAIIRTFLLRSAPLTDDESAYRFMAEVLATGRLSVESHPAKAFFDRVFMINDGRFYGQYFIGWSALMVPGVWLGITGYMNAVYSALTVPAIFGIVRRLAGSGAARVATLLFLASPMLMVGAATEMAHTSCVMALAWLYYFLLRSRGPRRPLWAAAAVAFFFGLAFLIRPTSAIGVGTPALIAWLWTTARTPERRTASLASFAVPALLLAAVFFGVNLAQNGSPLATSYARLQEYMKSIDYQNVGWSAMAPPTSIGAYMLPKGGLSMGLAGTAVALGRVAYDLFGLPLLLGLAVLAASTRAARIVWASFLGFVAVHFFTADAGVDTFGPVHYYELALPIVILCGVGYARFEDTLRRWRPSMPLVWPQALVASLVIVALMGFAPVRLAAIKKIAFHVNAPIDAVRDARISHAVVFTIGGYWVPMKCSAPTRHFVYFRPNNDLRLKNDILWLNHLGWEQDREFVQKYFPGRTGYLLNWNECQIELKRM